MYVKNVLYHICGKRVEMEDCMIYKCVVKLCRLKYTIGRRVGSIFLLVNLENSSSVPTSYASWRCGTPCPLTHGSIFGFVAP
jgi:hypothetical protein